MEDIVEKEKLLYEGKAKKLYFTDDSEVLWVEYCDQATALNGARKEQITGKGALNNQILTKRSQIRTTMPEMKIWLMEHGQMGLIIKIRQLRQLEIQ